MHHAAVIAAVGAVATGVSALLVPRRLRPDMAARLITAFVVLSVGGAVWALLLIVTANVVRLHGVAEGLDWCTDAVAHHRGFFTPIGFLALGVVIATAVAVISVRVRARQLPPAGYEREFAIVASDEPIAYALPGRPGQVVVSTGMLRSLDSQERRVLLAHEWSHLRRRHHSYIRVTAFAVAVLPIFAPVNARLRFAIERWADEDAADEVGDRALVACAIARAALASQATPRLGLAIADAGVVERVQIMLDGPSCRSPLIEALLRAMVAAGISGFVVSLLLTGPWVLAGLGLCR